MSDDPIDNVKNDPLTKRELQETRYTNTKVITEMVDPSEIRKQSEQHDLLWWALGWLPTIAKNWKILAIVVGFAVLIGGQDLIGNIVKILEGLLP